jgi:hypothetical protein
MTAFKKPAATKPVPANTPANKAALVATPKTGGGLANITKDMGVALQMIAGIDEVEADSSQFFPVDFEGVCSVQKFKFINSPRKCNMWIVEFRIETSSLDNVRAGDAYTFIQNMDKYDYGKKSLVQFCQSAKGLNPLDRDRAEELAEEKATRQETILSYIAQDRDWEAEPVYVYIKTRNKPKEDGSPFTLHNFFPVPAEMFAAE